MGEISRGGHPDPNPDLSKSQGGHPDHDPDLSRPNFCRDIIPLEISCPWLMFGNFLKVAQVFSNLVTLVRLHSALISLSGKSLVSKTFLLIKHGWRKRAKNFRNCQSNWLLNDAGLGPIHYKAWHL